MGLGVTLKVAENMDQDRFFRVRDDIERWVI